MKKENPPFSFICLLQPSLRETKKCKKLTIKKKKQIKKLIMKKLIKFIKRVYVPMPSI
jgi:hypothetical protein